MQKRFAVSAIVRSAEEALFASSSIRKRRAPSAACYSVGYFVGILIIFGGLFLMASALEKVQSSTASSPLPLTNNLRATGTEAAATPLPTLPPMSPKVAVVVHVTPEATARPATPPMEAIQELFELGRKDPLALIAALEQRDPLGVNFTDPHAFQCPGDHSQRLDYPGLVNMQSLKAFRDGAEGSFIFYQHLRKAGGTGFCDLAKRNLPAGTVPAYYCMPDNRGSLALPPWGEPSYIARYMREKGFKIAANEWDVFHADQGEIPNVVLATTMRHPVDRWYPAQPAWHPRVLTTHNPPTPPPPPGIHNTGTRSIASSTWSTATAAKAMPPESRFGRFTTRKRDGPWVSITTSRRSSASQTPSRQTIKATFIGHTTSTKRRP